MSKKPKILQQALDPSGDGGVSAEYRALQKSALLQKYIFEPMLLLACHRFVNIRDVRFYYRKIKASRPDIVHVRGAAPDGLNAVIAAKLAGNTKVLVAVHGMYSDLVYVKPIKRWISKNVVEKLTFKLADGISCVCHRADQRKIFDKYRDKMMPVVYNRIPDYSMYDRISIKIDIRRRLKIAADAVVGVYVGRVTKEKGLSLLAEALLRMDGEWPKNFEMMVVGEGPYKEEFQHLCSRMKNKDCVHFVGFQSEVYRFLLASDFFVLPSLHENHSISLLEATAAKLPVIATDVGGNAEIVTNGETGVLIAAKRSDELLSILKKMATDTDFRKTLANNLENATYKQFESEDVDSALDCVYSKLLME